MPAVNNVLNWVPELDVTSVPSGCCGMAGAFGYEAEHVEVSRKMAEASLLPAVREAGEDTVIVADGTSCRHQIKEGTQREALHVARVLADVSTAESEIELTGARRNSSARNSRSPVMPAGLPSSNRPRIAV